MKMTYRRLVLVALVTSWSLATDVFGADRVGILDILPSIQDLGKEWTTNSVVVLVDPYSRPAEISNGMGALLDWARKGVSQHEQTGGCLEGRTGYCLVLYGCGDSYRNNLEYEVCAQAWSERQSLDGHWTYWKAKMEPLRVPGESGGVGEDCYWTRDTTEQHLHFRRGLFQITVSICGVGPDPKRMLRLAQAIDARIGKEKPKKGTKDAKPNHG
jgi:hypothetical protein